MINIFDNQFFIAIIPALLIAFATYISYMNSVQFSAKSKFYEKRLLDFYLPVFLHLESSFYKKINIQDAIKTTEYLDAMIKNNYHLVNDRIIDRLKSMKINIENNSDFYDDYKSICSHIDADLDNLQYKLGLPQRGFIYRINQSQLTINSFFRLNVLKELFFFFILPFLFVVFFQILFVRYFTK